MPAKDSHNVFCSECGATGLSKCPYCRSIFQTDPVGQIECMMTSALEIHPAEDDEFWMIVKVFQDANPLLERDKPETAEEALIKLHDWLGRMIRQEDNFPSLKQFLCQHKWRFMEGKHSQIDCGHG